MESHAEETMDDLEERRDLLLLCGWSRPKCAIVYNERESFRDDHGEHHSLTSYKFECGEPTSSHLIDPEGFIVPSRKWPLVTSSLDAWDKWVWPMLRGKGYRCIDFFETDVDPVWQCDLGRKITINDYTFEPTISVLFNNKGEGGSSMWDWIENKRGNTKIGALVNASKEALR